MQTQSELHVAARCMERLFATTTTGAQASVSLARTTKHPKTALTTDYLSLELKTASEDASMMQTQMNKRTPLKKRIRFVLV